MTTEARVNTANRFDPYFRRISRYVLLVFALFLFLLTILLVFFFFFSLKKKKKKKKKNHVFCEFSVLPKFCEIVMFSVLRKNGDFKLST